MPMFTVSIPCPEVGKTVFVRRINHVLTKVIVQSVVGADTDDWKAVVLTDRGHEFITGERATRNETEWRPEDWVWDEGYQTYKPPGTVWNKDFACFIPASSTDVAHQVRTADTAAGLADEAAEAAARAAQVVKAGSGLPTPEKLPQPEVGEQYLAWRARVRKEYPVLIDHRNGETVIKAAWTASRVAELSPDTTAADLLGSAK